MNGTKNGARFLTRSHPALSACDMIGYWMPRGEAAEILGVSTGNLIDFLSTDDKVWEEANHLRARFGHKPLRGD